MDEKPTPLDPPLSGGKHTAGVCQPLPEGALNPPNPPAPLSGGEPGGKGAPSPDKGRAGEGLGFVPYNKKLTELARENRRNPTAAESRMWNQVLRMRCLANYKFLRQKPIGSFIVDFYCSALRLAIEVDGDSHAGSLEYDAARTADLNARGITIVRYSNDEVMRNLEGVYDDLLRRVVQISAGVSIA